MTEHFESLLFLRKFWELEAVGQIVSTEKRMSMMLISLFIHFLNINNPSEIWLPGPQDKSVSG